MVNQWQFIAILLMGMWLLTLGVWMRLGWNRRWRAAYFGDTYPRYLRNGFFALIPGGLFMVLIATSVVLSPVTPGNERSFLATTLGLLGLLSMVVAAWFMIRPPEWTKPRWLREEELARREGRPVGPIKDETISPRAYRVAWVLWLGGIAAWFVFDHPAGLLAGLGLGGAILLAARPRVTQP
jgi:hypothetical protein